MTKLNSNYKKLEKSELLFIFAIFLFYFACIFTDFNSAPDEDLRFAVSNFFFENNRLPKFREASSDVWGFSYALSPTLLRHCFDFVAMKIGSLFFGNNSRALLLSARTVSAILGTLTVYFTLKCSKLLLRGHARVLTVLTVAFLPQFMFINSYVNNDCMAVCGASMILYAWALAYKENWDFKNALLLCFGMSMCALSYFNSYTWILASMFVFLISYFLKNPKDYKGFTKVAIFIIVTTLLMIGYLFVREYLLYHELLGFKITHIYGEEYAIDELKPSHRTTCYNTGTPFPFWKFIGWSLTSFIGRFGYMDIMLDRFCYLFYYAYFLAALMGLIYYLYIKIRKKAASDKLKFCFRIAMIFVILGALGLSMYYSYFMDYQPQGRYLLPCLPAVALLCGKSYNLLLGFIKNKKSKKVICGLMYLFMTLIILDSYRILVLK